MRELLMKSELENIDSHEIFIFEGNNYIKLRDGKVARIYEDNQLKELAPDDEVFN